MVSILSREAGLYSPLQTPFQSSLDTLLGSFVAQASDPKALAAMLGGGFAYRFTRLASLPVASSLLAKGKFFSPLLVQASSCGVALATESLTFTSIQRQLNASPNPSFGKDWLHTAISLASLKIFGSLGEKQNIIFQHLLSDVGMLSAHRLASWARVEAPSSGDVFQDLIHAEMMNWQMKAGMGMVYSLAPGLFSAERSLDLNLSSQKRAWAHPLSFLWFPELAGAPQGILPSFPDFRENLYQSNAQGMEGGLPLKRRDRSVKPWITGLLINAVTRTTRRVSDEFLEPEALRRKLLSRLPLSLCTQIQTRGKGYGLVLIPGMYNQPADPAWMNLMSAAFEQGGVIVSTAVGKNSVKRQGLYSMIGENKRVLQPNWRMEVALVIGRLALALKDPRLLQKADKLVIVGYSKGGLLGHALKALQEAYDKNGALPPLFYELYPGLSGIPPQDLQRVMQILPKSKFVLLASPIEGIPYNILVKLADALLLEGSAQAFEQKKLRAYFDLLGLGPEAVLLVHSQMPSFMASLLQFSHPGNIIDGLAYRPSTFLFYGLSFLMRAREGDALVKTSGRYPVRLMRGRYNHVDIVVNLSAATELLQIIFSHISADSSQ